MDKPTKILIAGIVLAAIVLGIGKGNAYRNKLKLRDLQAECVEEGKREASATSLDVVLICDPIELIRMENDNSPSKGVQAKLLAAQRNLWESEGWFLPVTIAILVLSALPWLWYFLLRRIRELRDAVVGK